MSELVQRIHAVLKICTEDITYWTDSTITLSWISNPSYTWNTFVANRVAKIQTLTNISQWKHIDSHHNPADLISRGLYPVNLINSSLWFHGPEFLTKNSNQWPESLLTQSNASQNQDVPERRSHKIALLSMNFHSSSSFLELIHHRNEYFTLLSIIGYCYRFTRNAASKRQRIIGPLLSGEIEIALIGLVRCVQRDAFHSVLQLLSQNKKSRKKSSRLCNLCPFLDSFGVIRVGGRLEHSVLPFDAKHQILLPKDNSFTLMLMQHLHKKNLHTSPQSLLSITRQRFWPIDGLTLAKRVVSRCLLCYHMKPKIMQQVMGDLPRERIVPGRPFLTTGVDFCGSIRVHFRIRGKGPVKAYIAIFVCFTTKAVHLELVSELTSEAFIASLKRFVGRRGLCKVIFVTTLLTLWVRVPN